MPKTNEDRVIALAGVVQAAILVRSVAQYGQSSPDEFTTSMNSLVQIDAPTSSAVYGGLEQLAPGLHILEEQLKHPQDVELARYVTRLLRLEEKLSRRRDLLAVLQSGIQEVLQNLPHFPATHSNTIARFADLYLQTISTLTPRIMVSGVQAHLDNPENAKRIRALLLAGVRSAMLWRQSGGGRWSLLFQRKTLLNTAHALLTDLNTR